MCLLIPFEFVPDFAASNDHKWSIFDVLTVNRTQIITLNYTRFQHRFVTGQECTQVQKVVWDTRVCVYKCSINLLLTLQLLTIKNEVSLLQEGFTLYREIAWINAFSEAIQSTKKQKKRSETPVDVFSIVWWSCICFAGFQRPKTDRVRCCQKWQIFL